MPPGQHAVSAQNPAPADCASDANRTLTVVEAPQVLAASPGLICPNEGDAQVRFTLSDALEIDGEISAFELTNLSGERAPLVGDWADCEAIEAQDHEVRRCATFTARIPQETPDQHYRPTLTVTPPSEALCGFEGRGALWILPPPVITAVGPQFICLEGDEVTLEIEGEGVFQIDGVAPEIRIGDAAPRAQRLVSCAPLEIPGASVLRCAKVQVTYDRATLDSGAPLTLRNPPPADCATEASYDLNIIEPPRIDNATPQMACGAVGEITIEIEGASFFQAPGNEETGQPARLPRVVINGRAIPPAQLTTQGCQGVGAADQGWSRCDQISVSLDLSVYDPGILSVEVTNPAPTQCGEPAVTQLVVLPPVGIARVTPPEVCGEDDPVPITLSGQGFISLDGAPPTVRVAGQAIPATVDECEDLPGAPITDAQGAEVCRTLRLAVIPSALPAGPALIEVENPGELACVGQAQGLFMPIAPPIIEAVRPEVVCGGVERSLEITGGGFIEAAEVRLGDAEGEVDFIDASALSARFGAEVMVEGLYDLRVRNAVGCEATIEEAVEVMAQPQIVGIEPPTASNAADTPARLITSGLREPVASVTLLGPEGATARLNGQSSAEDPNLIDVIIPSGLVAGDWQARVVSRAGCVGLVGGALEITEGAP
ncbi:hypothetical protein KKB55_15440 [Myxococcota bacterium]|nr:hypothetical protein [Myxococcota bacterium]